MSEFDNPDYLAEKFPDWFGPVAMARNEVEAREKQRQQKRWADLNRERIFRIMDKTGYDFWDTLTASLRWYEDAVIHNRQTRKDKKRLKDWRDVIAVLEQVDHLKTRAVCVQTAVAQFGPVPDELGGQVRALLRSDYKAEAD